jgi:hypothetical protein
VAAWDWGPLSAQKPATTVVERVPEAAVISPADVVTPAAVADNAMMRFTFTR